MKSRVKAALIAVALAAALPVVAWTGIFLYWHITIKREIAAIEREAPPLSVDSTFEVVSGGCRTLPYLIDVLETSRHSMMLHSAIIQITSEVGNTGRPREHEEWVELMLLVKAHPFNAQDAPDVRRANHQLLLEWWKANQAKYHQWWRVWSSKCGGS